MPTEYCRHIRTTGRRCGCPALRAMPYCYFHERQRTRHHPVRTRPEEVVLHPMRADAHGQAQPLVQAPPEMPLVLDFPPLEDRESIQVAASMIVAALGRGQLDPKRASGMLYGLQVAAAVTRYNADPKEDYIVETDAIATADGDLSLDEDPAIYRAPESPENETEDETEDTLQALSLRATAAAETPHRSTAPTRSTTPSRRPHRAPADEASRPSANP